MMDICFVGFKHSPLYSFGMSANKLWDYMMASKPIIMSIDSCNDPVAEANCGITISSGKTKDIAKGINDLLSLTDNERQILGDNGKKYVIKSNAYDVLAKKCIALFKKHKV